MALEVRRVDVETGELLMPWRRFPSIALAARAFDHEISVGMISRLINGIKPQHNGFEARRCGDQEDGNTQHNRRAWSPRCCIAIEVRFVNAARERMARGCHIEPPR